MDPGRRRVTWIGGFVLTVVVVLCYANSFQVPLLLDDVRTIADNSTIRHLWPLGPVLAPPAEVLSCGRPWLNLTYALNYAAGGQHVIGYHLVNLLVHLAAALVLFGLVRRTLELPRLRDRYGADASILALAIAGLWAVHPIQTEAVNYLSQRAESLMGLCYLGTFYCFLRGATAVRGGWWYGLAVGLCALGMATKEVMVTAPFLLLTYDWTFLAGSLPEIWQRRRRVHAAMAGTWLLLAYLMISSHLGSREIGSTSDLSPWTYFLTECRVVVAYLRLAFWPRGLVFDYGWIKWADPLGVALLYAALLGVLLGGALVLWRRKHGLGWLGLGYFVLLAPTSSIVPIPGQPMAESRLYLPLALLAAAGVLGGYRLLHRRSFPLFALLVAGLASLTFFRNQDYQSSLTLWRDTVAKRPESARAHFSLAYVLAGQHGSEADALAHYAIALQLRPDYAEAHDGLATVLADMPGREAEALAHYEVALRLKPNSAAFHNNLAALLANIPGREADALAHYEVALRLNPDLAEAHANLAAFLARRPGREAEAAAHYVTALRLNPDSAEVHDNFATLLARQPGRVADALFQYAEALRLKPNSAEAHYNLASLLARLPGREAEAETHYAAALRLKPDSAESHNNLGALLARLPGREAEALSHYAAALRIKPDSAEAHNNLGALLARRPGREAEAQVHYVEALRLNPAYAEAHNNLANLLADRPGGEAGALTHYAEAVRLMPNSAEAQYNLATLLARIPGREAEAETHYVAALRIKPESAQTQNNLGALLARLPGRDGEAQAHYVEALRLDPDYAEAHNNLANLLAGRPGGEAEALTHYAAAVRLMPDSAGAHYNLGLMLEKFPGRQPEAREQFAAALRLNPAFAAARDQLQRLQQQNR